MDHMKNKQKDKTLNQIFLDEIEESIPILVLHQILVEKIEAQGLALNNDDLEKLMEIARALLVDKTDEVDFELNATDELDQNIIINVGDVDDVEIRYKELIDNKLKDLPEITEKIAKPIFDNLEQIKPKIIKANKKDSKRIQRDVNKIWGPTFDSLETLISISLEVAFALQDRILANTEEDVGAKLGALTMLHSRSCEIASEIVVLLRQGFPNGAEARWRSLHELNIISTFLQTNDPELSEKYLKHEHVESLRAAKQYYKYYKVLGFAPISVEEIDALESTVKELVNLYGKEFKNNYGWAATTQNGDPNFSEIEKSVNQDHMRPFYKKASYSVHATPKGVFTNLNEYQVLEQATNYPFWMKAIADPTQNTALSLSLITINLLTFDPEIDDFVAIQVLLKLQEKVFEEVSKAHQKLINPKRSFLQRLLKL